MKLLRAGGAIALLLLPIHLPDRMSAVQASPVLPSGTILRGTVTRHATLESLLDEALTRARIHELVRAARPVYDLERLALGRPFGLSVAADGLLLGFGYRIDDRRTLRVRRIGDQLLADVLTQRFEVRVEGIAGVIRSSLFEATAAAGERDQLALDLADIFAWDVDFNTEIRKGDSFRVSVEKLWLNGRFAQYGRILAAELQNGSRTLQAVRYEAARGPGYYAPDGTPLRKAFLRSPLRFTRISSRYATARPHPILQRSMAHRGIDYAAPRGTPVNASADGVVSSAGSSAGLGNTVRLRHANGFETLYGHLSRILVRRGQRVFQGEPIGAVGQSGLATGPHLHYSMLRNGSYTNPLSVQLPPAEPIPDDEREAFFASCANAMRLLDQAHQPGAAAAAAGDAVESMVAAATAGGQ